MTMTPIIVKERTVSLGMEQITVKGEVFTSPVLKTEGHQMFTHITFKNQLGEEVYSTRYFEAALNENDLRKEVKYFTDKMVTDFKNAHK